MELWASVEDLLEPEHPNAEEYLRTASHILYRLTGEKYGGITTSVEYHRGYTSDFSINPQLVQGSFYNFVGGGRGSRYDNSPSRVPNRELFLERKPAREIISVYEMGRLLDPSEYTLRNSSKLRKKNGTPWMMDEYNEVVVEYSHGTNPPSAGRSAAVRLADQFYLQEIDSEHCVLPQRVSSVSRQGINISVIDTQDFLLEGRTGVYDIDLFIKTYNPDNARTKAKLRVAGRPRGEH